MTSRMFPCLRWCLHPLSRLIRLHLPRGHIVEADFVKVDSVLAGHFAQVAPIPGSRLVLRAQGVPWGLLH